MLVPRRFIGYRLKDLIGDDARTSFHQEVLQYPLVQQRFTIASILANPDDLVAIRAWLGFHASRSESHPQRNREAYRSLSGFSGSGREFLCAIAGGRLVPAGAGKNNITARAAEIVQFLDSRVGSNAKQCIEWLFDPILANDLDVDDERRQWVASDLFTLREAALMLAEDGDTSLASVMATLRYRVATRAPLGEDSLLPRVRIMTLHSAKGLQGDNIIVAGVADPLTPGLAQNALREEQRRLLYVAITRAKDSLIVSWPRSMAYDDATRNNVRIDKGTVHRASGRRSGLLLAAAHCFPMR